MKPHKCPVCEGTGEFVYTEGELPEKCKACDGKGVVWPPLGYYPPYMPPTVIPLPAPQWPQQPWGYPNSGTPFSPPVITWCWGGAGTHPTGAGC